MLEFGTDGVRGRANSELSVEFALRLGQSVAKTVSGSTFVVGRDTRASGSMLQAAFAAGLCSRGASVLDVGVIPSPGVAYLCSRLGLPGAVISASHNPYFDNGIKILGPAGTKLSPEAEAAIEAGIPSGDGDGGGDEAVGTITDSRHLAEDYFLYLAGIELVGRLDGMKVVVDTGNGAASGFARRVYAEYGARVVVINDTPDGTNINLNAGSTHMEAVIAAVREERADLGLAFDGDADRVLAVDEKGAVVDGDFIMAILAEFLEARGLLANRAIAVTVMSNLGLRLALEERGIGVIQTDVGDRNVFEAMRSHGLSLGGEQSGHIILSDLAWTGDGMLTGLVLAGAVRAAGLPASLLAGTAMQRLPQVLTNVPCVGDASSVMEAAPVAEAIGRTREALGEQGRVLVRPSGTEPVIRVMVEARDEGRARSLADAIASAIESLS
ncbi:MAG: phosphoglucosamine mutase [Actinomycetota bacterium]|nr:phosphoglucosamine mutase [Actinomycetota bacterium]